jgi:hypothetical protein
MEDSPTRNEFNQRNATRDREIEDLKDRIVRMDGKLDRLLERGKD